MSGNEFTIYDLRFTRTVGLTQSTLFQPLGSRGRLAPPGHAPDLFRLVKASQGSGVEAYSLEPKMFILNDLNIASKSLFELKRVAGVKPCMRMTGTSRCRAATRVSAV